MPGVILGTAAYMAPEQAKGRPVDKRADIWAFGCVVYEMITGRRAFAGDDISETIASILRSDPDWTGVPASVKPLLVSCLQRDPRQRLRDVGDVALLLNRAPVAQRPAPSSSSTAVKALTAVSIVALLASGLILWRARATSAVASPPVVRMSLRFPANSPLQLGAGQPSLAVSSDGKTIAYTASGPEGNQLWTHSLDASEPRPLEGTSGGGGPRNVFFSPDGRQIAFFSGAQLKRVPVTGGTVTVICEAPFSFGGTWTDRDEIVLTASGFGPNGTDTGLWRVIASGGEKRAVTAGVFFYPDALPGGRVVIASVDNPIGRTSSDLKIVSVDIESGEVRPLIAGGAYPRYAATGHVLFLKNGAILATPIDVAARTASDQSKVVVPNVFMNPAVAGGNFAVSGAGTLAYAPGTTADFSQSLLLIDAQGQRTPASDERRYFDAPKASPDGAKIAVGIRGWRDTVWLLDRNRNSLTELTTGDMNGLTPVWSPDGNRVVFASYGINNGIRNLHWIRTDGLGGQERLLTSEFNQRPNAITPDGKTLVFEVRTATSSDVWTLALDAQRTARPLLDSRFNETGAALSPSGDWMAFTSDQSGKAEIYLTRFPSVDRRIQVSTTGGRAPVWSRDGQRLYYRSIDGDEILAIDIAPGASPALSRPLTVARLPRAAGFASFDVMPDGRLLVIDDQSAGSIATELRIVVNWFGELRQRMAGGR
jgi:Tol biopolymer transport system component